MSIREIYINNKKIIISVSIILVAAVLFAFIFYPKEEVSIQEKVYSVRTMKITPTGNDVYLNYAGLIQPDEVEKANMPVIGKITKIYVEEGDAVTKGQMLFKIDSKQYEGRRDAAYHNFKSAETGKNSAKSALDYAQKVYDESAKLPTQEEKDKSKEILDTAQANQKKRQEEYDKVKELLNPYEAEVSKAQSKYDTAQSEYKLAYEKKIEIENKEEATEEEKLVRAKAVEEATKNVNEKEIELQNRMKELQDAKVNLGFLEKETQLVATKSETILAQSNYDKINKEPTQNDTDVSAKKSRLNSAQFAYDSACSNYNAAKSTYETAQKAVDDCVYYAGMNGNIIMMIGEEGTIATPIAPIMVIGSNNMIAQFGISQSDVVEVKEGMKADIIVENKTFNGTVDKIALMPDETSRTYTTNVKISNVGEKFHLGELATVKISIGERTGIWLPISVVMNDGQDYVFTVENDRVVRKNVVITDINNDMVRVTGLENITNVISEGMKTVKSGNLVNVISEG